MPAAILHRPPQVQGCLPPMASRHEASRVLFAVCHTVDPLERVHLQLPRPLRLRRAASLPVTLRRWLAGALQLDWHDEPPGQSVHWCHHTCATSTSTIC
ncbi:hypothetical protein PR202_gb16387 [Eleusine coracana subsp. coracana]|uniref:Uncharacterized protein n=1 Tax=Eleusine coracana subsp. coracana TaxID=191504 RepID=A0AAV5F047_ELECO|nr:hypothetical protein PR202_gb16387 [Eleusine coracana subsp. coracana]